MNQLKNNENYIPDIVILLQATSPLRKKNDIDQSVRSDLSTKQSQIKVTAGREPSIPELTENKPVMRYVPGKGTPELQKAIQEKFIKDNDLTVYKARYNYELKF